jgi:cation transport protein ChaC
VLGLDRGGSCVGLAFRVPGALKAEVTAYLRERELVTNVYLERLVKVRLEGGDPVEALSFVVDRAHRQYAGSLDIDRAVSVVSGATGQSGRNEDYVFNTVHHLEALGIHDHWLESVSARLPRDQAATARPETDTPS